MSSSDLKIRMCDAKVGLIRCNRSASITVCYHDDGYENRKYASFCEKHGAEYSTGKLRSW
jgi:hypothetical protein